MSTDPKQVMRELFGKVGRRVLGDAAWVNRTGDFRDREGHGLVERPVYAYGLLRAADSARYFGKKATTVCEFGVAEGRGLINMIELAEEITKVTGIEFRIFGFDTGKGLPTVEGHKDHPELWNVGDFPMVDKDALVARLGGRAEMVFGDLKDTIDGFVARLDPEAPVGFMSIDVDIYSGTVSALRLLDGKPELYMPAISMYFDDIDGFFANDWCGELAAMHEFNAAHEMRKIGPDRSLPGGRPVRNGDWYTRMYCCHVLDHEYRQRPRDREPLTIADHQRLMKSYAEY